VVVLPESSRGLAALTLSDRQGVNAPLRSQNTVY
jgi:hypothetical protein